MKVYRYIAEKEEEWNAFLDGTKNSTFLFNRKFMDYHKDRFNDFSLMVYNDQNALIACLPANLSGSKEVTSHGGLTYGGLILKHEERVIKTIEIFHEILKFLYFKGYTKLILKDFPKFYNNYPSEEIEYVLFLSQALLYRRDTAIVIDQDRPLPFQTRRIRSIKKAVKENIQIDNKENYEIFWNNILVPNLIARHGVKPVHNVDEILSLKRNFPNNILLKTASIDGEMMAGAVLFIMPNVVHAQYISASAIGRKNGSLDFLFAYLIKEYSHVKYFDFGICNENAGKDLNKGLLDWKEGFGGRTYCHNFYEVETKNHQLLDKFCTTN